MENNNIKRIFKYYLKGKKYLKENNNKSIFYFTNVINMININKIEKYKIYINIIKNNSQNYINNLKKCNTEISISNTSTINSTEINDIIRIINQGDINTLELLLKEKKINWNIYNENKMTPLHFAVINGDCNMVKLMLYNGANVNTLNGEGHTPLELACIERNPNMINYLTLYGVNLRKQILLRQGCKNKKLSTSNIDMVLIIKLLTHNINYNKKWKEIWENINNTHNIIDKNKFDYIMNLELWTQKTGWDIMTWDYVWGCLTNLLTPCNKLSIINICLDELSEQISCDHLQYPQLNIENCLYSLLPIFNYNINIKNEWVLNYELITLAKHLKNKNQKKDIFLKKYLQKIWNDYIDTEILSAEHLNKIIKPWIKQI